MPLPAELRKSLNSRVADIANLGASGDGRRPGGRPCSSGSSCPPAPPGRTWTSPDQPSHEGEPYGYTPNGGTGCAVRTLVRLAEDIAENG